MVVGNIIFFNVTVQPKQDESPEALLCVGSESMSSMIWNLMEKFKEFNRGIRLELESEGSSSVPASLLNNRAQIGAMSRQMTLAEKTAFKKKYGTEPLEIIIAIDSIAFFVNRINPIQEVTIEMLASIYSEKKLRNNLRWNKLTSSKQFNDKEINLYGRNSASGTSSFVKENVLNGVSFSPFMNQLPSSGAVIYSVSKDINGIGFCSRAQNMSRVKILQITNSAYETKFLNDNTGRVTPKIFSLKRNLYIYVNRYNELADNSIVLRFIKFIFSQEGKQIIENEGFSLPVKEVMDIQIEKISK